MLVVVTGPVRSGKSSFALQLARERGGRLSYVATALIDPSDAEMRDRVARHRADRPDFETVEPDERGGRGLDMLLTAADSGETLVIDALGTWIGNLLLGEEAAAEHDAATLATYLEKRVAVLVAALTQTAASAFIVCEETGWGVVPVSALGRIFRDTMGRATAQLARRADAAYLVVAGHAIDLKATGRPVTEA